MTSVTVTQDRIQTVVVTREPPLSVVVGTPDVTSLVVTEVEHVDVHQLGIIGPRGPQGIPGSSGAEPIRYALLGVSSWSITHTFDYRPEVRLIDTDGQQVGITVFYPDIHSVALSFPAPFSGEVQLS